MSAFSVASARLMSIPRLLDLRYARCIKPTHTSLRRVTLCRPSRSLPFPIPQFFTCSVRCFSAEPSPPSSSPSATPTPNLSAGAASGSVFQQALLSRQAREAAALAQAAQIIAQAQQQMQSPPAHTTGGFGSPSPGHQAGTETAAPEAAASTSAPATSASTTSTASATATAAPAASTAAQGSTMSAPSAGAASATPSPSASAGTTTTSAAVSGAPLFTTISATAPPSAPPRPEQLKFDAGKLVERLKETGFTEAQTVGIINSLFAAAVEAHEFNTATIPTKAALNKWRDEVNEKLFNMSLKRDLAHKNLRDSINTELTSLRTEINHFVAAREQEKIALRQRLEPEMRSEYEKLYQQLRDLEGVIESRRQALLTDMHNFEKRVQNAFLIFALILFATMLSFSLYNHYSRETDTAEEETEEASSDTAHGTASTSTTDSIDDSESDDSAPSAQRDTSMLNSTPLAEVKRAAALLPPPMPVAFNPSGAQDQSSR